jgi:hypothetical protein
MLAPQRKVEQKIVLRGGVTPKVTPLSISPNRPAEVHAKPTRQKTVSFHQEVSEGTRAVRRNKE